MKTEDHMAKTATKNRPDSNIVKGFEESLWETANKLRGSVASSEYKHIVLSLIFLKFVSDKFEAQKQKLIEDGHQAYAYRLEFYAKDNIFYLPKTPAGTSSSNTPSKTISPCIRSKKAINLSPVCCRITTFHAWSWITASYRL